MQKSTAFSSKQVHLLEQCVVWQRLSVHLGWGYNNVRAAYDEVSEKIQSEVYENAKAFAKENKDRYDCGGYIYVGEGQDLGQFWAKLAVGDGKIQKSSSNTADYKNLMTAILYLVRLMVSILIKVARNQLPHL